MAASKNRIDWALLILRIGVGGLAIYQGFGPIRHARGTVTVANALHLGAALGEIICGTMILVGVWMLPAVMILVALIGWPLVQGWLHGAPALGQPYALFRVLATVAAGLGGGGKWGIRKG